MPWFRRAPDPVNLDNLLGLPAGLAALRRQFGARLPRQGFLVVPGEASTVANQARLQTGESQVDVDITTDSIGFSWVKLTVPPLATSELALRLHQYAEASMSQGVMPLAVYIPVSCCKQQGASIIHRLDLGQAYPFVPNVGGKNPPDLGAETAPRQRDVLTELRMRDVLVHYMDIASNIRDWVGLWSQPRDLR